MQELFTLRSREVVFRMELSGLKVYDSGVPLHLRKNLVDGYRLIHLVSGRSGDQNGYKKCI